MKTRYRNLCAYIAFGCAILGGIGCGWMLRDAVSGSTPVIAASAPNETLQNAAAGMFERPVWHEPQPAQGLIAKCDYELGF